MARRTTSARLVGRNGELADLVAATRADDPDRPVILVSGEAGIGKSRLLAEMTQALRNDQLPEQATVVRGSCVRLAEADLPFTPIREILDGLLAGEAPRQVEHARASLAGIGAEAGTSPEARTRRFIEIHEALVAASSGRPLVVVVDDLHWADQSTLDLLLFLARRMRGTGIVLVGAYRSDELHRRHPLRPVVAELSRGFVRERIELGPLDRLAVVDQIGALRDVRDDALVQAIVDRADGNPFFVEELVALAPGGSTLPATLRDVLLARLAAIDDAQRQVLDAGAVLSCGWDIDVLQQMVGLDHDTVLASVAAAVDGAILSADSDGRTYRFRHSLLEEAVHDDLLPARRVDLHRRAAAVLTSRADAGIAVGPAELAWHLDKGGQTDAAIDAYIAAAEAAFRAMAWVEGITAFERGSDLIAKSGDHRDRMRDLVVPTAEAMNWIGTSARAIALLRDWIAQPSTTEDLSWTVSLWLALSRILNDAGDEAGSRNAVSAAAHLAPPDESTAAGVDLLIGLAGDAWMPGRMRESLQLAERAIVAAQRLGHAELLFRALLHRAQAQIVLGNVEQGLADVTRMRELQGEHGWLDRYGQLPTNIGVSLTDAGFLDLAQGLWEEGLQRSQELGVTRSWDPWNLPGIAYVAYYRGEWVSAQETIAKARALSAPGMPTVFNELAAAMVSSGRGDLAACDAAIATAEAHAADLKGEILAMIGLARVLREDAANDQGRRLDEARAALDILEGLDTFILRSRLAAEAASAAAELATSLAPRRDARRIDAALQDARWAAVLAAEVDRGRVVPGSASLPWTRANAALAAAESARAEGADDATTWHGIADAFDGMGMSPPIAYARFRSAGAALRTGDRKLAEADLREALGLAASIGMAVLERRIQGLARASRLELESAPLAALPAENVREQPASPDQWGLSTREREVLALVAVGRTNGEIGARLFISAKTASVHVTHILDKLGVSSRTEAALLASQAGLLG